MGLLGGNNNSQQNEPDVTKKSTRKQCWASRDEFFACLDKNNIEDAIKNPKDATKYCGDSEQKFENDCIKSWVEYFKQKRVMEREKERQMKVLEERGATKVDITTSFK